MTTTFWELLHDVAEAAGGAATVEQALRVGLQRIRAATGWGAGYASLVAPAVPTEALAHADRGDAPAERRKLLLTSIWDRGADVEVGPLLAPGAPRAEGGDDWIEERAVATRAVAVAADLLAVPALARATQALSAGFRGAVAVPVPDGGDVMAVLTFLSHAPVSPDPDLLRALTSAGAQLGNAVGRVRAEARLAAVLAATMDEDLAEEQPAGVALGASHEVLRGETERLATIIELQEAVAGSTLDSRALVALVETRAKALFHATYAAVGFLRGDAVEFPVAEAMLAQRGAGGRFGVASTLVGRCVAEDRPLRCDDVEADARVDRAAARALGIRSLLAVPVRGETSVSGVLAVVSDRPGAFGERDVRPLELLAAVLAGTLTRAMALEANQRLLAERTAALGALRDSEARFQAFMDNAPIMAALMDAEGRFAYANRSFEARFRTRLAELRGRRASEVLPPAIARASETHEDEVLATGRMVEAMQSFTTPDGSEHHWLVYRFPLPDGRGRTAVGMAALDITERARSQDAMRRQALVLETIHDAVVVTDRAGRVTDCNAAACLLFGFSRDEMLGALPPVWREAGDGEGRAGAVLGALERHGRWAAEETFRRKDGGGGVCETIVVPLRDAGGDVVGMIGVSRDLSERQRLTQQLMHAQKLEAVGQLAAGIAHEINTPTQYVSDNVGFLTKAFGDLSAYLARCAALAAGARERALLPELVAAVDAAARDADLEFLVEEIPTALQQSLEGLERIADIVRGVKAFAHPGSEVRESIDLNREIENTITVSRNEWKYVADVETDLDPSLPPVPGISGEIGQVVLNVLVNAAHAVGDAVTSRRARRGRITVTTRREGDAAVIRIADTGGGIPEEIRDRIFDPFFTTKAVGRGTGQGLAIAHRLVTENHGGTIAFETVVGEGTVFVIRLPVGEGAATERAEPLYTA